MKCHYLGFNGDTLFSVLLLLEDDYNSSTSLDQEMDQNQKCKIGVFGDSQASVPSTISGLCNQQGQNNVDSGSSLGGIGISMTSRELVYQRFFFPPIYCSIIIHGSPM
jgi:hypothetical protein